MEFGGWGGLRLERVCGLGGGGCPRSPGTEVGGGGVPRRRGGARTAAGCLRGAFRGRVCARPQPPPGQPCGRPAGGAGAGESSGGCSATATRTARARKCPLSPPSPCSGARPPQLLKWSGKWPAGGKELEIAPRFGLSCLQSSLEFAWAPGWKNQEGERCPLPLSTLICLDD